MLRVGEMVALNVLLWLGCAGVGLAILSGRAVATSPDSPDSPDTPAGRVRSSWSRIGPAACIGLGALLACGSVMTLLAAPVLLVTWVFIGGGLALLGWRLARGPRIQATAGAGFWTLLVFGTVAFVLAVEAIVSLSKVWPNPCDDLLAYIPMAQRLLDTGQVIEPWSLRRLQHLGGQPFLQAFPIGTAGHSAFGVTDTLTASTFLAGLFVANGFRRVPSRLCCVAIIFAIPMFSVPRGNSATVFLTVPLLMAGFMVVAELRTALSLGLTGLAHRWAVASGLLLAGCASLRTNVTPVAGLVLVVGVLTAAAPLRARIVSLSVGIATTLAATAGWALGSWQSSGTPAFPVIPGNVNPTVASSRDPALQGFADNLGRMAELLQAGAYGPFVVAVLLTLLLAVVMRRRLPDAPLMAIAALAALANIVFLSVFLTLGAKFELARYTFPIPAALMLFFLYEVMRGSETLEVQTRAVRVKAWVVLASALLLLGYVFAPNPKYYWRVYRAIEPGAGAAPGEISRDGRSVALETRLASRQQRSDYEQAAKLLRARGRAIAAVDRPFLIDYRVDDIPSLDLVGWAAPGGDFPLLGSTLAKVQVLRGKGFDLLLATDPDAHSCTSPTKLRLIRERDARPGPLLATYHLAWVTSLVEIMHLAPGAVERVGSLLLIDLAGAAAGLAPYNDSASRSTDRTGSARGPM